MRGLTCPQGPWRSVVRGTSPIARERVTRECASTGGRRFAAAAMPAICVCCIARKSWPKGSQGAVTLAASGLGPSTGTQAQPAGEIDRTRTRFAQGAPVGLGVRRSALHRLFTRLTHR
jgi:hypothetical protein